jgi:hypothetical protein
VRGGAVEAALDIPVVLPDLNSKRQDEEIVPPFDAPALVVALFQAEANEIRILMVVLGQPQG